MSHHRIDDRDLTQLVTETTRRLHRNALVTGSAWVELSTVGWLLAAVVIDLILPMPVWARLIMWTGFWAMLITSLSLGLIWPMVRSPTADQVAIRIERAVGGMHNRLLTILDLHNNGHDRSRFNLAFVDRLINQARQKLTGYKLEQVADPRPMRRSLAGVVTTLLILLALSVVFWDRVPTAVARVMMPTANIPPATYLQLSPPGDLEVLHGESLTIPVEIARGSADEARLHYRTDGGQWVRYPMNRDESGAFTFSLSAVTENADYFISAGSTWTPTHRVRVVPRPVIEEFEPIVHLPDYMGLPEPRPVEPRDHVITAPQGSTIEVATTVSGEATRGEVVLLQPQTITRTRQVEEEKVWFEDELPADAVPSGRWRWSTARVHSGIRAHTFGWDGEAYGMETRLNPLHVPTNAAFFVYTFIDPRDQPDRITITLTTEEHELQLTWGEPADDADAYGHLHPGDLPPAGQWTRLEVPMESLPRATRVGGGRFVGITFAARDGRAFFDRPGSLRHRTESREVTTYEEIGAHALSFDNDRDRWVGRFPLEADRHFTVRLFNSLNQQSASVRPLRAVATEDSPPRIIVDRPARDVSLLEPQAVPLAVRAVDDYGIASIGVAFGPAEDELGETLPLGTFTDPRQSRSVTSIIGADRLSEDHALHYRFEATDRKGQSAVSETYRVTIVPEDQPRNAEDEPADRPTMLDDMLDALSDLIESPFDLAEALAELAESLPESVRDRLPDTDGENLLNPDGTPMSEQEIRELFEELYAELDEQQRQQLRDFDAQLQQRQQEMQQVADQLREAAEQAAESPLSLDGEAESLQMAAEDMQQMAEQTRSQTASEGDPADLEQFAQSQNIAEAQQDELEQLRENVEQLDEARDMAQQDAESAQAQTQATRARMQAQRASQSLSSLDGNLQQQQGRLENLSSEQRELGEQTSAADDAELDDLAEQQADLDERAAEQLAETRQTLGEDAPPSSQTNQDEGEPSADASDQADATAEAPEAGESGEAEAAEEQGVAAGDAEGQQEGAGEQSAAERAQMQERQRQQQQELDAARAATEDPQQRSRDVGAEVNSRASRLEMAQRELEAAREEAEQAAARQQESGESQPAGEQQPSGEPSDSQPGESGESGEPGEGGESDQSGQPGESPAMAEQPGEGEGEGGQGQGTQAQRQQQASEQLRDAAQELEEFIASPEVQDLLSMAERANGGQQQQQSGGSGQQSQQANQQGQPATQAGYMSEEEVQMMLLEQLRERGSADDDDVARGYYRLPPRARQSLLQGMREQGPEGYQSLIDAYYRELSREVE